MPDKIRLTSSNGGSQWQAFERSGFAVEISRAGGWNDPLYRVSGGAADIAVSLSVGAAMAAKAVGPYEDGRASHIRALARLVRPDQHLFHMVRADLGVRSFAELAIAPDFMRGLANTEPCLTVANPGFDLVVSAGLPDHVVYRLAKALNETSERAWAARDVFSSMRHAAETPTPLHPGAARYYRAQRVLN